MQNLCFSWKICFVKIYALCHEIRFVVIYARLCGEKIIQNFLCGEKMTNIRSGWVTNYIIIIIVIKCYGYKERWYNIYCPTSIFIYIEYCTTSRLSHILHLYLYTQTAEIMSCSGNIFCMNNSYNILHPPDKFTHFENKIKLNLSNSQESFCRDKIDWKSMTSMH